MGTNNNYQLETLEDRLLLSGTTFVVNSLADVVANDGVVTLREAIEAANANHTITTDVPAGSETYTDTITFDIEALQTEAGAGQPLRLTLTPDPITISDNININGPGRDVLTLVKEVRSSVFSLANSETAITGLSFESDIGITGASGKVNLSDSNFASCFFAINVDADVFINNVSVTGSQRTAISCSTAEINDSVFTANKRGALSVDGPASITNSAFYGNSGTYHGVIYCSDSLYMAGSIVCGNQVEDRDDEIIKVEDDLTIINSNICFNSSGSKDGYSAESSTVENSIIVLNNDEDIFSGDSGDTNFTGQYERYYGEYNPETGAYNIDIYANEIFKQNPSAGPDEIWGTADDNYGDLSLKNDSLLIGMGENDFAVDNNGNPLDTDIQGKPRILGITIDIGAIEADGLAAQEYLVESYDNIIAEDGILTFIEAFEAANTNTPVGDAPAGSTVYQDRIILPASLGELDLGEYNSTYFYGDIALIGSGNTNAAITNSESDFLLNIYNLSGSIALENLDIHSSVYGEKYLSVKNCNFEDCGIGSGPFSNSHIVPYVYVENVRITGTEIGICSAKSATIVNSSICDNEKGIYSKGNLYVYNSTIAGNSEFGISLYDIYDIFPEAEIFVVNSTVCENGRGISMLTRTEQTFGMIANSIIANNNENDITNYLPDGHSVDFINNIIGVLPTDNPAGGQFNHNITGTQKEPFDPKLSELTELPNGQLGYYPLPASLALNRGDYSLAVDRNGDFLSTDLASNARLYGNNINIGAIEGFVTPEDDPAQTYVVNSLSNAIADDGLITLPEAIMAANTNEAVCDAPAGSYSMQDVITFANGLSGTIMIDTGELEIYDSLKIIGPGSGQLTLDAGGNNRVINISEQVWIDITGLTVTNGFLPGGLGAGIKNSGVLSLDDIQIINNNIINHYIWGPEHRQSTGTGSGFGAGLLNSGDIVINDCIIMNNNIDTSYTNEFNNNPTMYLGAGGGICSSDGLMYISNSIISNNSAVDGGGISFTSGELIIIDSIITNNTAIGGDGGGIQVSTSGYDLTRDIYISLTIQNTTISDNTAQTINTVYTSYGRGGGLCIEVENMREDGYDDPYEHSVIMDSKLDNVIISGNSATTGGGLYIAEYCERNVYSKCTANISNSIIVGNTASEAAGGLYNLNQLTTISSSTIVANSSPTTDGIDAGDNDSANLVVNNSIIAYNGDNRNGGSTYYLKKIEDTNNIDPQLRTFYYSSIDTYFYYAKAKNNSLIFSIQPAHIPYPDIFVRTPSAGADEIWGTDDDDWGNLHLKADINVFNAGDNSLAVDAFGNALTTDIEGNPRIAFGTVDLGAYEFQEMKSDIDADGSVTMDDFEILSDHFGQTTNQGKYEGDLDGNGVVNIFDFLVLKSQFGLTQDLPEVQTEAAQTLSIPAYSCTAAIAPADENSESSLALLPVGKDDEAKDENPLAIAPPALNLEFLQWQSPLKKQITLPELENEFVL